MIFLFVYKICLIFLFYFSYFSKPFTLTKVCYTYFQKPAVSHLQYMWFKAYNDHCSLQWKLTENGTTRSTYCTFKSPSGTVPYICRDVLVRSSLRTVEFFPVDAKVVKYRTDRNNIRSYHTSNVVSIKMVWKDVEDFAYEGKNESRDSVEKQCKPGQLELFKRTATSYGSKNRQKTSLHSLSTKTVKISKLNFSKIKKSCSLVSLIDCKFQLFFKPLSGAAVAVERPCSLCALIALSGAVERTADRIAHTNLWYVQTYFSSLSYFLLHSKTNSPYVVFLWRIFTRLLFMTEQKLARKFPQKIKVPNFPWNQRGKSPPFPNTTPIFNFTESR